MPTHRIGIDFGRTIGMVESESDPLVFNMIRMLITKYGSENVFIVSKARPVMQTKIREWLECNNYYPFTGFDRENVYFVREYTDKQNVIINLDIDVFIDDHCKIIRSIMDLESVTDIIWFNPKANINLIPQRYRNKITIMTKWNRLWNYSWNK